MGRVAERAMNSIAVQRPYNLVLTSTCEHTHLQYSNTYINAKNIKLSTSHPVFALLLCRSDLIMNHQVWSEFMMNAGGLWL